MEENEHSPRPLGPGIALIGYRATGKSTVGRIVARQLDRPFVDCDSEIEKRSGQSIGALFANEGEAVFRDWEERTIREVCEESPGAVLATGGGSILRETNRRALKQFGLVFWLTAPAGVLIERLRTDQNLRPSLSAAGLLDEVGEILQTREPLYRSIADEIVDASDHDPASVAARLLIVWRERLAEDQR